MKTSTIIAIASAALVSAQCDTSKIPTCAKGPIDTAIASVCSSSTDYACACGKQQALTSAATPGVLSACGADVALNQVLPAVQAFCSAITSGQCGGGGSGGSSSSSSSSPSSNSPSSSLPSSSSAPSSHNPPTTQSSPTKTAHHTSTPPTTTPALAGNGTSYPTSKPSTVVTAGAAVAGSIGSLGMVIIAALAAF